jgi:hypothetical protein
MEPMHRLSLEIFKDITELLSGSDYTSSILGIMNTSEYMLITYSGTMDVSVYKKIVKNSVVMDNGVNRNITLDFKLVIVLHLLLSN